MNSNEETKPQEQANTAASTNLGPQTKSEKIARLKALKKEKKKQKKKNAKAKAKAAKDKIVAPLTPSTVQEPTPKPPPKAHQPEPNRHLESFHSIPFNHIKRDNIYPYVVKLNPEEGTNKTALYAKHYILVLAHTPEHSELECYGITDFTKGEETPKTHMERKGLPLNHYAYLRMDDGSLHSDELRHPVPMQGVKVSGYMDTSYRFGMVFPRDGHDRPFEEQMECTVPEVGGKYWEDYRAMWANFLHCWDLKKFEMKALQLREDYDSRMREVKVSNDCALATPISGKRKRNDTETPLMDKKSNKKHKPNQSSLTDSPTTDTESSTSKQLHPDATAPSATQKSDSFSEEFYRRLEKTGRPPRLELMGLYPFDAVKDIETVDAIVCDVIYSELRQANYLADCEFREKYTMQEDGSGGWIVVKRCQDGMGNVVALVKKYIAFDALRQEASNVWHLLILIIVSIPPVIQLFPIPFWGLVCIVHNVYDPAPMP
ncbi:hypothetical protein BJ508DRAFT_305665 [Ascobolus immersus RN42]|uniref:Uncharacterized protein n=1 Tax=Ascobolus immersus RN42 TaxID=1160509 RepID=A0A3N4IEF8_ASCIM|nr:hypothetical protein BJ508DRAFT_305665 [Ascobolus immersus RN42]